MLLEELKKDFSGTKYSNSIHNFSIRGNEIYILEVRFLKTRLRIPIVLWDSNIWKKKQQERKCIKNWIYY